jgi:hypothetical protein
VIEYELMESKTQSSARLVNELQSILVRGFFNPLDRFLTNIPARHSRTPQIELNNDSKLCLGFN